MRIVFNMELVQITVKSTRQQKSLVQVWAIA